MKFNNLIMNPVFFLQLDPLVVQAFKCKVASKKGRKEIESFTNVLSDMYSSIELWIPQFEKVLSSLSVEFDNQLGQSCEASPTVNAELSNIICSRKQTDLDSHVSPSPLVSWRADCTIENSRQLFLLTPLPRSKAHPSKNRCSSKLAHKRNVDADALPDANLTLPSSLFTFGDTNDDLIEGVELKPKPNEVSNSTFAQTENTPVSGFLSPPRFSYRERSVFLMTPCLKVSPPKSCVVLEPISESSHPENHAIRELTPFVFGNEDGTSESSSGEITQSLALKYPELFGTKLTHKQEIGRQVEASPAWFISPPKTCVLMEPPDKRLSINPATKGDLSKSVFGENKHHISAKDQDMQWEHQLTKRSGYQGLKCTNIGLLESTPVWESDSTLQTGKRQGENTLKRELWTKFEAASSSQRHFDVSICQETKRKGFLDMLEEVSSGNTSSSAKGL
ncbi:uncharacterized protein LOC122648304 [Telopea speciosissima]|uniref:uncharacterized protein LOC122648304 n=1 Tax=Telopea speciosissima TaxID=54955 RepID=UPI001CC4ECCB|nr:uncharacterized protein LOC122648304 [Telopea speciosissima]